MLLPPWILGNVDTLPWQARFGEVFMILSHQFVESPLGTLSHDRIWDAGSGKCCRIFEPFTLAFPSREMMKGGDAVAIFTGHSCYKTLDLAMIRILNRTSPSGYRGGRNILDPDRFIKNGWIYSGICRGDKNNHLLW